MSNLSPLFCQHTTHGIMKKYAILALKHSVKERKPNQSPAALVVIKNLECLSSRVQLNRTKKLREFMETPLDPNYILTMGG